MIVWQNNAAEIDRVQYVVTDVYKQDARLLVRGDIKEFITGPDPPSDATIIMHPPGYPMFIAVVYGILGENETLRIVQIMLCSLISVLAFLFGRSLLNEPTAIIAGLMTAISPQFAYYSGMILPDEMSALPLMAALYFLARMLQDKRLAFMFACGVSLGAACWLRSNFLLLPLFVALAIAFIFPSGHRLKPAAAMLAAAVLAIAPMTLRNYFVFDAFIPVSVGFGTTFIEGLGEMDRDAVTGLPITDEGVMLLDAEQFGRSDLYGRLYAPDGIARERDRVRTGLKIIKEDPDWFLRGVFRRGLMTFRMERVPVIDPGIDTRSTTPAWLYWLNVPLKLIQRLFITAIFFPLIIVGTLILLLRKEDRPKLLIIASMPLYFFIVQPIVHTEYRYLLPATHALIILASLPLGWLMPRATPSDGNGLPVTE